MYALGIKSTDFKNLQNDNLSNEISSVTSDQRNLVANSLKNLKANSTANLLKSTDPAFLKLQTHKTTLTNYKENAKYFKNYKTGNYNIGFATTLKNNNIVISGDFKEASGENKMYRRLRLQTSNWDIW